MKVLIKKKKNTEWITKIIFQDDLPAQPNFFDIILNFAANNQNQLVTSPWAGSHHVPRPTPNSSHADKTNEARV